MKDSIILGLLQNIGILVAFAMVYEITWLKSEAPKSVSSKIITGLVIGGIGVVLMFSPWTLMPGVVFDTRSIMLAVSGLFFGFIPTLVAMIFTGLWRVWMGGGGMWMGVAVIFSSGTIGILWNRYRPVIDIKNSYLELLLLGFVVHMAMLCCTLFLPSGTTWPTIKVVFFPLLLIYTPGTMFLGILMLNQTRNVKNRFALEKVNELERRLSEIMKSGNIVSLILDVNARILFCNKYLIELTGYTEEEVMQRDWLDLFLPPETKKDVSRIFRESLRGDSFTEVYENQIIGKNGDRFYISWHNNKLFNEKNELIGVACLGVNFTQRKLMEQQLSEANVNLEDKNSQYKMLNQELLVAKEKAEESDRLKSAFLANLSHEIRTPMNAIMGFTDLLREPDLDMQEKDSYINVVHKSGMHLLSIINDIIEMSRIEAGFVELGASTIDLSTLFDDLYKTLFVTIPEIKKIELVVDKTEPGLTIIADEVKLRQILINLISNAIKYSDTGTITFGYLRKNQNELHFWVQDTGIGIDEKHHELIFNRFRQVDEELKFARGGFGLGLSISKAYVEMMGGELSLVSELEKGSLFSFYIPLVETGERIAEVSPETIHDHLAIDLDSFLLIAEDDETNFNLFEVMLKNEKFPIIHALDGKEAVEICKNTPQVKLVLMDIKMPVMNGFEALKKIREIRPELKVIAQTAYALGDDKKRIAEAGFDDYLTKPLKRDQLLKVIRKYMV